MKALTLTAYNQLTYGDVPDPKPEYGEVLIQIKSCGICGSDIHGMDGSTGRRIPPLIMGHEASGVIAELGSGVADWKKGDRVTFDSTVYKLDDWYTTHGMYNLSDGREVIGVAPEGFHRDGAFAEYVTVPSHILINIPDEVSFDHAAMVEPAAVAFHAVKLAEVKLADTALVVGAGMVGLFVVQALKLAGCAKVIAVDLDDDRLKLAAELGADVVFNAAQADLTGRITALSSGRGADIAIEVVGAEATLRTAMDSVRRGGTVVAVGNLSPEVQFPIQSLVTRQIRLQGSCAICGEFPDVLDMIASGGLKMDPILSATAPLSEGALWFDKLRNREPGLMKVILKP